MKYHILSPFNCGSCLVYKLIEAAGHEPIEIVWKHTMKRASIVKCIRNNPSHKFIVMYRHPGSWLTSMKKTPYNIILNKRKNVFAPVKFENKTYRNIMEVYKSYFNMYLSLSEYFNNIIWVSYDKLIKNKLEYFNKRLKTNMISKTFNEVCTQPSKDHGKPVSSIDEANRKQPYKIKQGWGHIAKHPVLANTIRKLHMICYEKSG